ncbi:MAG TPA: ABC transporter permease subunit, partial [Prosthecobacter sp.]|nr:ABC transporter permease subunit [Prosthecobacter sp.]
WEFLSEEPRESNTEGGIFPAMFGTFVMTLLMAILVTPLGIIAAIYMREYATQGMMVRAVRICVNNLAGVPSIVFGVFGVGFFIYGMGGFIDRGVKYPIPPMWWFIAGIGAVASVAAAVYLSAHNRTAIPTQKKRQKALRKLEGMLWLLGFALVVIVIACCPYFHGFFNTSTPTPTFGTGGILWASLTLALMTLPVVIVATEEALVAVPRGVREAALACGASKWQTIQRIVLPGALPGVMTGVILAMARGAGEVAPLMITGVTKFAPSLPLDLDPPFIHAERAFMHLGFHIYDLGFQSPDSEGAKPMVFATTLLLIVLVVTLNLAAIQIRAHLRKRFQASAF